MRKAQTVKKLSSQRSDKGLWIYRSETNGFDSRKATLVLYTNYTIFLKKYAVYKKFICKIHFFVIQ